MEEFVFQRIKQIVEERFGGNVTKFSSAISMNQPTVNNYMLANRKLSLEFICCILQHLNISAEWLFNGIGEMFLNEEKKSGEKNLFERLVEKLPSCGNEEFFESELEAKDEEIRRLKKENNRLQTIIDSLSKN